MFAQRRSLIGRPPEATRTGASSLVRQVGRCGDGDRHPSRPVPIGGKWSEECRMAVLNVRGGVEAKMYELIEVMKERKLDVVCLAETKRKGSGAVDLPGGMVALWSGVSQSEHASRGVGVLLSSRLANCVTGYDFVNPRLLWVRLKIGLTKIFVVATYAPVSSSPPRDLEEHWEKVRHVLSLSDGNERQMVIGDLNGWVGTFRVGYEDVLGEYGDKKVNEAGKLILDLCVEKSLFVSNTMFEHKRIHQYTWERTNDRSMIDLFLIDRQLRKQVMDTRAYRGADLGTDHFLVVTRFRGLFVGWRHRPEYPKPQAADRIRSWKLQDAEIRNKYTEAISSKLTCTQEDVTESIEECWQNLRDSMVAMAEKVCGVTKGRTKKKGDAWWDEEVKEAVSKKRNAWCNFIAMSSEQVSMKEKMKDKYRKQKQITKEVVARKRERYQLTLDSRMSNNFQANSKLFWKEVRSTRRGSTFCRMNVLLSKSNAVLSSKADILARWSEYYKDMYDNYDSSEPENTKPPSIVNFDRNGDDVISMKEIERAIRGLKCGKAAGHDNVTAEMVKYGGPKVWNMFHLLCNLCWRMGDVPDDWRRAVIVPLYKGKGSRMDCASYRAISLTSLASKVYTKILTNRMQVETECRLWEAQGGFRTGRGCSEQIFSVRRIVEKFLALDQKVFCAFVDLEKAFDRVVRKELWEILPEYGVDGRLQQAVRSLYSGHKACVRAGGDMSPWFEVLSGVKQGCVMSATLFITYLDRCLKRLKSCDLGMKMGDLVVNCLLYADDAVLLAPSESELQTLVSIMKEDCEEKGLHLNAEKTKVLVFERDEHKSVCNIRVNGKNLEQVNEMVYLGSMLTRDGRCEMDVERRVTAGNRVNGAMEALVSNKNISQKARLAVHSALLVPTLLYGSESWICQKKHESKVNAVEMRSLRKLCGVTIADRIRNDEIRNMAGLSKSVINKMKIGMLRWFGHVERMTDERLAKKIYLADVNGRASRGRPRLTYEDQIKRVLKEGNIRSTHNRRKCMKRLMDVDEAREICKDRVKWRSMLSAYPSRDMA